MLRFLTAETLSAHPRLADEMFRHRAGQFARRRRWAACTVDGRGWERDAYDGRGALYVVWQRQDGGHGGSARFRPMAGQTLLADHFPSLAAALPQTSATFWECTRFCLAPRAGAAVAPALMLGGAALMQARGLAGFLGLFDRAMWRVYRGIGAVPQVLAQDGSTGIALGLWPFTLEGQAHLARRAGLCLDQVACWLRDDLG